MASWQPYLHLRYPQRVLPFKNMFISDKFGSYTFKGYDSFKAYYDDYMAGQLDPNKAYMNQYRYGQANTDVTGDPNWASEFSSGQFGFMHRTSGMQATTSP